jgi:hypothetical protein
MSSLGGSGGPDSLSRDFQLLKSVEITKPTSYNEIMKEMTRHAAGRIYLIALLLSIIGFIVFLILGGTEAAESGEPIIIFGWMTAPLFGGIVFVVFWLVAYIVYFFFYWPYR